MQWIFCRLGDSFPAHPAASEVAREGPAMPRRTRSHLLVLLLTLAAAGVMLSGPAAAYRPPLCQPGP
ncbi:hypothetical protein GCM10027610_124330 [Dactylosporangium cerinum]